MLRTFIDLLEREQTILVGQQSDELQAIADTKLQLADKISSLISQRKQYLPADNLNTEAWLRQHIPQGIAPWQQARQLAEQARQLNQTNGELIQIKLRYNQQALTALYSAAQSAAGLYGADGQTNIPAASRPLGSV